jgi:hypothetical protein
VSDIRAFVAEVMRELAVRPPLEDPLDVVMWPGEITAVLAGDDAPAKRRLACRLISLGLPELEGAIAERGPPPAPARPIEQRPSIRGAPLLDRMSIP